MESVVQFAVISSNIWIYCLLAILHREAEAGVVTVARSSGFRCVDGTMARLPRGYFPVSPVRPRTVPEGCPSVLMAIDISTDDKAPVR